MHTDAAVLSFTFRFHPKPDLQQKPMTQTERQKLKLLLPATPIERSPETKYTLTCHTQWGVYTTHITVLICQARWKTAPSHSDLSTCTESLWPTYRHSHGNLHALNHGDLVTSTCTESWRPIYMHWIMATHLQAESRDNPHALNHGNLSTCTESWQPIYMHWIMAT